RFGIALVLFLTVSACAGWLRLARADQATALMVAQIAERLRPSGLEGAVLAVGGDQPSEAAINRFVELAGGEKAELVVAVIGSANADSLLDALKTKTTASLTALPLKDRIAGGSLATVQAMRKATGVWLVATDPPVVDLVRDMA